MVFEPSKLSDIGHHTIDVRCLTTLTAKRPFSVDSVRSVSQYRNFITCASGDWTEIPPSGECPLSTAIFGHTLPLSELP